MEKKTKVNAEEGRQEIWITREFDLPLELLFRAHEEPEIVEQWMTSKVVRMEGKKNGSYQLEKADGNGNIVFSAGGVFHEFIPNKKITRTFEMANTPFGVQLEVYEFEKLTDDTSKLNMHVIYESVSQRDAVIQLGMTQGIGFAHDRLQKAVDKIK